MAIRRQYDAIDVAEISDVYDKDTNNFSARHITENICALALPIMKNIPVILIVSNNKTKCKIASVRINTYTHTNSCTQTNAHTNLTMGGHMIIESFDFGKLNYRIFFF